MAAVAPSASAPLAARSANKSKAAKVANVRLDLIAAKMAATADQDVQARPAINASAIQQAAALQVNAHQAISAAVGTASAQPTQVLLANPCMRCEHSNGTSTDLPIS